MVRFFVGMETQGARDSARMDLLNFLAHVVVLRMHCANDAANHGLIAPAFHHSRYLSGHKLSMQKELPPCSGASASTAIEVKWRVYC